MVAFRGFVCERVRFPQVGGATNVENIWIGKKLENDENIV